MGHPAHKTVQAGQAEGRVGTPLSPNPLSD